MLEQAKKGTYEIRKDLESPLSPEACDLLKQMLEKDVEKQPWIYTRFE